MSGRIEAVREAVHHYPDLIVVRDKIVQPSVAQIDQFSDIDNVVRLGRIMRVAPRRPIMNLANFQQYSADFFSSVVGEDEFNLGSPGKTEIQLPYATIYEPVIQIIRTTTEEFEILNPNKALLIEGITPKNPARTVKNYGEVLTIVVYPELTLAELYVRAFLDKGKRFGNVFDFEPEKYRLNFHNLDRAIRGELFKAWKRGDDLFGECYPEDICTIGEITQ